MKLRMLRGTNPVFVALYLQNRFQALLDEIIQQEEREMEQVKALSQKRWTVTGPCENGFLFFSFRCHTCALIWPSFTSPDSKCGPVQLNLSAPASGIVFLRYGHPQPCAHCLDGRTKAAD